MAVRKINESRYRLHGAEDHVSMGGRIDTGITPSTSQFSVMFWMYSTSGGANALASYQTNFDDDGFVIRVTANQIDFILYSNTTPQIATATFKKGMWHCVMCTYRSGASKIWIDGNQEGSGTPSPITAATGQQLRLGQRSFSNTSTWTGYLKDFVFKNGVEWGETDMLDFMLLRKIPTGYTAYYTFNGNANDEGGVYNGTAGGTITYEPTTLNHFH